MAASCERAPCLLQSLDLSNNVGLDGFDMALAVKRNESLTSIDFRDIPSANSEEIYSFVGNFLLQDDCRCRLGFLSCAALIARPSRPSPALTMPHSDARAPSLATPSAPATCRCS